MGQYAPPTGASDVLGLEVAGAVVAHGAGAWRFPEGAQVTALVPGGGYAEYCVVHESNALPIPAGLTVVEAAAIPETTNYAAAAMDARIVQIAFLRGPKAEVDLRPLMQKRLVHTGSTLRPRPPAEKAAIADALREKVWPLIEAGRLKPVIDSVFPLAEAAKAHARMESSAHVGKIVLTV